MINIIIQFEGKQLTLPINPEKINIDRSASNEDIDIIGLGPASRKGPPGLAKVSIDSFFPSPNSYFYTGVKPKTCVDFINNIWKAENKNNNVAKILTSGLPINLNMFFVIDSFTPEIRAGEEEDIYYTLQIKEYIPYGVKTVTVQKSGLAAARAQSTTKAATSATTKAATSGANVSQQQTYTVAKGDCLWNITKACCGNGARWKELYDLNKKVIGSNPNLIKPGQVLVLPTGWNTPTKVTKLTNINPKQTTNKSATITKSQPTEKASTSTAKTTSTTRISDKTLTDEQKKVLANATKWGPYKMELRK